MTSPCNIKSCNAKVYSQICNIQNIECVDEGVKRFLNDFCKAINSLKLKHIISLCVCDNSACPKTKSIVCDEGMSGIFDILIIREEYRQNRCIKRYMEVEIKFISSLNKRNIDDYTQSIVKKFNYACCDYTSPYRFLIIYPKIKELTKKVVEELSKNKLLRNSHVQVELAKSFINRFLGRE